MMKHHMFGMHINKLMHDEHTRLQPVKIYIQKKKGHLYKSENKEAFIRNHNETENGFIIHCSLISTVSSITTRHTLPTQCLNYYKVGNKYNRTQNNCTFPFKW